MWVYLYMRVYVCVWKDVVCVYLFCLWLYKFRLEFLFLLLLLFLLVFIQFMTLFIRIIYLCLYTCEWLCMDVTVCVCMLGFLWQVVFHDLSLEDIVCVCECWSELYDFYMVMYVIEAYVSKMYNNFIVFILMYCHIVALKVATWWCLSRKLN